MGQRCPNKEIVKFATNNLFKARGYTGRGLCCSKARTHDSAWIKDGKHVLSKKTCLQVLTDCNYLIEWDRATIEQTIKSLLRNFNFNLFKIHDCDIHGVAPAIKMSGQSKSIAIDAIFPILAPLLA